MVRADQSLAPLALSCSGGDGVKLVRFIADFGVGVGMRRKWLLPSGKDNCISNPAAKGVDSGNWDPTDLGAGEASKWRVLARLQDGA